MPCSTDRYFVEGEIAAHEGTHIPTAVLVPIVSPWGHRAGDPSRAGQEADAEFLAKSLQPLFDTARGRRERG